VGEAHVVGDPALRAGHAEKQARWQDLFAPLIEPRLPNSDRRTLQTRAIAAAAIVCLQAANEEWVRLGGQVAMYDTAVQAARRPTWRCPPPGPPCAPGGDKAGGVRPLTLAETCIQVVAVPGS
jgi:hypothetical protein